MVKEDDRAPALTLVTSGGETIDIANPGQRLLLFFYPKDMTPGCTTEAKDFSAAIVDFANADTKVVGISRDSMARHGKFIDKEGLTVPLASDEDGALCEAFGVWTEKMNYGRAYMGIERSTFLIAADGTVERVWRKVRVKGHVAEVLAALAKA